MHFKFNERKAAQTAAWFIQKKGGVFNYQALLKLLYLADRRSLVEKGRPITRDAMFSMDQGPILSEILNRFRNKKTEETKDWYEYVTESENYTVSLAKENPETDELSKYELKVLEKIFDEHGHKNRHELVNFTHNLPEWKYPGGSSCVINPEEILKAQGIPEETIKHLSHEANEVFNLEYRMDDR